MKLIIDIDEELYNYMQTEGYDEHLSKRFDYQIRFAVKGGTPLPKVSGRLIILSDDVVRRTKQPLRFSCQNWISEVCLSNATVAIIEPDKGGNNEATN